MMEGCSRITHAVVIKTRVLIEILKFNYLFNACEISAISLDHIIVSQSVTIF